MKKVIFSARVASLSRKGAASRSQTACALNGKRNSMVEPASRGVRRAFTVPCIWWRGRQCRRWSAGEYSQALRRDWDWAVKTEDGSRTPFYSIVSDEFIARAEYSIPVYLLFQMCITSCRHHPTSTLPD